MNRGLRTSDGFAQPTQPLFRQFEQQSGVFICECPKVRASAPPVDTWRVSHACGLRCSIRDMAPKDDQGCNAAGIAAAITVPCNVPH
jgi:phosphatidylserine decarboxylase